MTAGISTRWKPGHVERRDSSTGRYECVNGRMHSQDEIDIQRALLRKTTPTPRAFWLRIDIRGKK